MDKHVKFWAVILLLTYTLISVSGESCPAPNSTQTCRLGDDLACPYPMGYIESTLTMTPPSNVIFLNDVTQNQKGKSYLRFVFCEDLVNLTPSSSISVGKETDPDKNQYAAITQDMLQDGVLYVAVPDNVGWLKFDGHDTAQTGPSNFSIYFEFVEYKSNFTKLIGENSFCSYPDPNKPEPYPPNTRFEWLIEVDEGQQLEITLPKEKFYMDPLNGDYLTIMPGNSSGNTEALLLTWKLLDDVHVRVPFYNAATVTFRTQIQTKPNHDYTGFCLSFAAGGDTWTTIAPHSTEPPIPTPPPHVDPNFTFQFAIDKEDVGNYSVESLKEILFNMTVKYCNENPCDLASPLEKKNLVLNQGDAFLTRQDPRIGGYCLEVTFHVAAYSENNTYALPGDKLKLMWDEFGYELSTNKTCIFPEKQQYRWWLVGAVVMTIIFSIVLMFVWQQLRLHYLKEQHQVYQEEAKMIEEQEARRQKWYGKTLDKTVFRDMDEEVEDDEYQPPPYMEYDPEFGTTYPTSGFEDGSSSPPESPFSPPFTPAKLHGGGRPNPVYKDDERTEEPVLNQSNARRQMSNHIYEDPNEIQFATRNSESRETTM